ncbi:hypothetical protein HAX54_016404 [Datura stramonium]|uniref:Uncharacterized protein n=1 Tax=Datura stramonium TaxID=4076 RepID=A0ABS8UKG0_DATST|nr:hypothetical protein [Datura stramonium]
MDGYSASPIVVARTGNVSTPSRNGVITAAKNHRHVAAVDDDDDGDTIECTGKSCKSCTGGVVADCVALCCCPCALIDILALAFFKIPWMMGRKYLGKGKKKLSSKKSEEKKKKKKKKKKKEEEKEMEKSYSYRDCVTYELDSTDGRISTRSVIKVEDEEIIAGKLGIVIGEQEEVKDKNNISGDEIWLDLYEQVGHLSFGRVSFSGIPSQELQDWHLKTVHSEVIDDS